MVSIIIPVYNVKPYLEEALSSVLSQTYKDLEIIIVDDGSTDGSGQICEEFLRRDPRIVVFHQRNHGLSSARNVGLEYAKGKTLAFLDSDDAFHPRMIEIMVDEMQKQHADIIMCDYSVHLTQHKMKPVSIDSIACKLIKKNNAFQAILAKEIESAVWNKLYDRKIWKELRFPDGYVYEGTYTIFDIFDKVNHIAQIDNKLVMHRRRLGSICNTFTLKNIQDGAHAVEHYYSFVKKHTPVIFSSEQCMKVMQGMFRVNLSAYLHFVLNNPEDKEGRKISRDRLIRLSNEENIQQCSPLIRFCYKMALIFPRISSYIFWTYRRIQYSIILRQIREHN